MILFIKLFLICTILFWIVSIFKEKSSKSSQFYKFAKMVGMIPRTEIQKEIDALVKKNENACTDYSLEIELRDEDGRSERCKIKAKIFAEGDEKFFGIPTEDGKLFEGSPKIFLH